MTRFGIVALTIPSEIYCGTEIDKHLGLSGRKHCVFDSEPTGCTGSAKQPTHLNPPLVYWVEGSPDGSTPSALNLSVRKVRGATRANRKTLLFDRDTTEYTSKHLLTDSLNARPPSKYRADQGREQPTFFH